MVTMAVLISRETSSPAVSVTLNSSDDSGVVSCMSSIVRGTLQTPGNSIREPLVPVTSLPSVCVVGCTWHNSLDRYQLINNQKLQSKQYSTVLCLFNPSYVTGHDCALQQR